MKIFKQLFIILAINLAGDLISRYLHLPLPGPITGMLLLLILLLTGVLKEREIRDTADFMLQNMGFFFIPAGVSVMISYHALDGFYFETVLVVVLSTILVMAVTALATQLFIRLNEKKNGKHH
ncbi:CidA/LrgA family protein [Mangrovibacterium marinum]|uniref:Holin-like protein n=1 Tax=Mangrovibacterium marinum TaxID=1639118 RepID=A0A2T5C333_9BACT|nr:CidA/LrgA family protein [Mangrovibacterium marinum]PTN09180.1 holin-like protein [Mangrovibacterium marinum]